MCGIVGYIGPQKCIDFLYNGLARLEYRGYDSAGIAVLNGGEIGTVKSEGKLSALKPRLAELPQNATRGIGHTRWATHGVPNTVNAHPHVHENIALVHNGIIENYEELKKDLLADGVKFQSQTDTEVVLQMLIKERKKAKNAKDAIFAMIPKLRGAFSLGILCADEPDALYAVKLGSPLVIGQGRGENYFASDAMAMVTHTSRAHFLQDKQVAKITPTSVEVWDFAGKTVPTQFQELDISSASVEKQGFKHFMLKEIHEQPRVMSSMIKRLVDLEAKKLNLKELGIEGLDLSRIENIAMVACGTAYYSAMLGKYLIEPAAGVPVNVELASEFRYRKPWLSPKTLVVAVSQSGETADTLACVKHAKEHGCQVLSVCNVKMSSIARESNVTLHMDAGPEIGVASTKAFTSMILAHYLFGLALGLKKGHINQSVVDQAVGHLRNFPALMDHAIDAKSEVEALAAKYYEATNFIFMGRGPSFSIALEGALKLKEISYIHAEGYAGGELKHGPIALIDRHMPVVALAPQDFYYEKMVSNIEEVKARQGRIISLGAPNDDKLQRLSDDYLGVSQIDDQGLQAILSVVPLQLLAYYVAVKRGTDVDQPRNLAKSVTVE
jgi:glucosamine--fructose-6-phosphate aminotransferase (isomerizing)